MNTTESNNTKLDAYARDIIDGYAKKQRISLQEKHATFLLNTLPPDSKSSVVALHQAVNSLKSQEFNTITRNKDLANISFESFSLATLEALSHMYSYQDRTIFEFAVAEWTTNYHARLTKRQIEKWEKDDNPQTRRVSKLRLKGVQESMGQGIVVEDDQYERGVYTLYRLDPGLLSLLMPGLNLYLTDYGRYSVEESRITAREIYTCVNQFITI